MSGENENTIDYRVVLADLEAKRAALDAAITSFKAAMPALLGGHLAVRVADMAGNMVDASPLVAIGGVQEVPAGAFFKKGIVEASKLYLDLVKKKQTTKEIVAALKQGGMESTAKDFEGMVGIVLQRASKNPKSGIMKLQDTWGLAQWYPAAFRLTQEKSEQKKNGKTHKRAKKAAKSKPRKEVMGKPPATAATEPRGLEERIFGVLSSNQMTAFSSAEIANSLQANAGGVALALGRMAAKNKAEKLSAGKYRAFSGKIKEMAKVG